MLGTAQQSHEGRSLFKQLRESVSFACKLTGSEHLLRGLGAHDEYAANPVRCLVIIDRAIAICPIYFLAPAVPSDWNQCVDVPSRATSSHYLLYLRANDVPDFVPDFACWLPQGPGMTFRTNRRGIRVVV